MEREALHGPCETGDIVCPLVYLREVFGLNYSRKTSNDRTRVIHEVPPGLVAARPQSVHAMLQQSLMVGCCKSRAVESRVEGAWFPALETII